MKFWNKIASLILRQRIWILVILGIISCGMFYFSRQAELSYRMGEVLPPSDPVYADYQKFRSIFGEEANVVVIAIKDPDFFKKEHLEKWVAFEKAINAVDSVEWTLSATSALTMYRNDSLDRFDFQRVFTEVPKTQAGCDSLQTEIMSLLFYREVLFNPRTSSYIMLAGLNRDIIHKKERIHVIRELQALIQQFEADNKTTLHVSGLPFIRTDTIQRSAKEIVIFVILAALITAIVLWIFFRSFWGIVIPLTVVGLSVIWSSATLVLFDYKITTLTGLLPPLLIVIGIPNAVFMITKYHQEYLKHKNKIRSLSRIIEKTGKAIFLTNFTTAIGFGTLIITNSKMLVEFGVVAFINIIFLFILSLTLIPILYSFIPPPLHRHTKHLTNKRTNLFVSLLLTIANKYRPVVYGVSIFIVIISVFGITRLKTSGKVADDVPKSSNTYRDLKFFEAEFNGVMPFEVMIDTKKKKGALSSPKLVRNISQLQDSIGAFKEFSKPVSVIELVKFANQSFNAGDTTMYSLPGSLDIPILSKYIQHTVEGGKVANSPLESYLGEDGRYIRIRSQMADVGTSRMKELTEKVNQDIKAIFAEDPTIEITLSGASLVIMKSTDYLLKNLFGSLIVAILLITGIMALLFKRWKMVIISMLPNILPLLFTAGLMGIFEIPVKASTCLIFSVAFGVSVDDAIHFLAKYLQELKHYDGKIRQAVLKTLEETGISMAYTSIILFFGFSIFMASDFGGTVSLGLLVSITLVVAMFTNLTLLPALLLSFHKKEIDKEYPVYAVIEVFEDEDEEETSSQQEDNTNP